MIDSNFTRCVPLLRHGNRQWVNHSCEWRKACDLSVFFTAGQFICTAFICWTIENTVESRKFKCLLDHLLPITQTYEFQYYNICYTSQYIYLGHYVYLRIRAYNYHKHYYRTSGSLLPLWNVYFLSKCILTLFSTRVFCILILVYLYVLYWISDCTIPAKYTYSPIKWDILVDSVNLKIFERRNLSHSTIWNLILHLLIYFSGWCSRAKCSNYQSIREQLHFTLKFAFFWH